MAWVHPLFDTSGRLHTYTFYTTVIKGEATDAVIEFERKGIVIHITSIEQRMKWTSQSWCWVLGDEVFLLVVGSF